MGNPVFVDVDHRQWPDGYLIRIRHLGLGNWRATIVDDYGRRASAKGTAPSDWRAAALAAAQEAVRRYVARYRAPGTTWKVTPIAFCRGDAKDDYFVVVSIEREE